LVHNGTVWGDHKKLKDVEVDSEAIAHIIASEPDPEVALKKINAAYALIWYDIEKKQLNIIRNKERPLAWVETPTAFYLASEGLMLDFVMRRCNQRPVYETKIEEFEIHNLDTWELQADRSHKILSKKLDAQYVYVDATKPTETKSNVVAFDPIRGLEEDAVTTATKSVGSVGKDAVWPVVDNETGELVDFEKASVGRVNAIKQAMMEATKMSKKPVPQLPTAKWGNECTYRSFLEYRVKHYPVGGRVKVVVKDIAAQKDDGTIKNVFLTGQSLDEQGIYAVFPIDKITFTALTDKHAGMPKDIQFLIDIAAVGWKRTGEEMPAVPLEDQIGRCTIMGTNPKIHIAAQNRVN
jgi:hypothetical protein